MIHRSEIMTPKRFQGARILAKTQFLFVIFIITRVKQFKVNILRPVVITI